MLGNPFTNIVPRKMTNAELAQAIRADLAGELDAIQATDDPVVKACLADIRDEEKAHMGELLTLLRYLDPNEAVLLKSGEGEVLEELEKMGIKMPEPEKKD